ncbi:MAG: exo-alpha-sialidase [Alphaproteobacteria bacterium]|nr:exo-alpha-sialidase [Alphaproteobacteria bacterium]
MRAAPGLIPLLSALWALPACAPPASTDDTPATAEAIVAGVTQVVPGPGLPADVTPQAGNNNLAIARWDGRLWLAFRSAPNHFASEDAEMWVVSSEDEITWRYEGHFAVGRDVREPHLVPTDEGLALYFAILGTNPLDFEPGGVKRSIRHGIDDWTEPESVGPEGLVAWRIRDIGDGRWSLFGYVGGEDVYALEGAEIDIYWLASDDGLTWEPAHPTPAGDGVVLTGGGSETSAVLLDDGSLVAVVRNEAGDDDGYGSKVCTAPADDLGTWTCAADPRKYDSPLVLASGGRVWLVGRRTLTEEGHYDLGRDDLSTSEKYVLYQGTYWQSPKRCSLWTVDPDTRTVAWVDDLPSKGDTCFPDAVEAGTDQWVLYNYSSDPEGPELSWIQGQGGPTGIWRADVTLR